MQIRRLLLILFCNLTFLKRLYPSWKKHRRIRRNPSTKWRWLKNEDNSVNCTWSWKYRTTYTKRKPSTLPMQALHRPLPYANSHLYLYFMLDQKHRRCLWCLCGSMGNSFKMTLWNLQNERHLWHRILHKAKKHHHHHEKHYAHNDFQVWLQNTRCKMV